MIELRELTKAFGDTKAVDGISLEIAEGEIFGFLGPNCLLTAGLHSSWAATFNRKLEK
jgi:ABC-type uncharacterized transport system ATPase subunit